ncbi:hypothetical protein [Burkholderia ambifaria]|uniref:hypothetical protein n=1 Tax=Burkholderia ambifaria TaxID=152480 RepID=UPI001588725B|nr:hypothetical protein [Burkholderia ambifaria]MDP9584655.1 hypothetical protein [Burkholderia contaminans]
MKIWWGILLLSTTMLAGCNSVSIDAAKRANLQQVSVSNIVSIPTDPYFTGRADAWGAGIGGAVGAAVASSSKFDDPKQQISYFLKQQKIDVGGIVRATFLSGLVADSKWSSLVRDESDTHFDLKVNLYGLASTPSPFSSDYKPMLSVTASLIDKNGNVVWRATDFVATLNSATPAATYSAFLSDPRFFRDGFAVAAAEITRSLLAKLDQ